MKRYSRGKAEENMPERPQGHIWIFLTFVRVKECIHTIFIG